jgi:hypothetical protein
VCDKAPTSFGTTLLSVHDVLLGLEIGKRVVEIEQLVAALRF